MKLTATFPMDRPDGEQDEYEATGTVGYERPERIDGYVAFPGGPIIEDLRVWRIQWDTDAKRYVRVEEVTGDATVEVDAYDAIMDAWRESHD